MRFVSEKFPESSRDVSKYDIRYCLRMIENHSYHLQTYQVIICASTFQILCFIDLNIASNNCHFIIMVSLFYCLLIDVVRHIKLSMDTIICLWDQFKHQYIFGTTGCTQNVTL